MQDKTKQKTLEATLNSVHRKQVNSTEEISRRAIVDHLFYGQYNIIIDAIYNVNRFTVIDVSEVIEYALKS